MHAVWLAVAVLRQRLKDHRCTSHHRHLQPQRWESRRATTPSRGGCIDQDRQGAVITRGAACEVVAVGMRAVRPGSTAHAGVVMQQLAR